MEKIRILLVDDHQIIRDGVKTMIIDEPDIDFVGCASNGSDALEMVKLYLPDIVISDISMPDMNGIELTARISELNSRTQVLILSMYTTDDYIYNAIKSGAKGIYSGHEYYSPNISKNLMKNYLSIVKKGSHPENFNKYFLTQREKEILKFYVEGFSNQEIANKLNISIRTVETHKNNIMQKFGFKSTVEMVKFALKNNLVIL